MSRHSNKIYNGMSLCKPNKAIEKPNTMTYFVTDNRQRNKKCKGLKGAEYQKAAVTAP